MYNEIIWYDFIICFTVLVLLSTGVFLSSVYCIASIFLFLVVGVIALIWLFMDHDFEKWKIFSEIADKRNGKVKGFFKLKVVFTYKNCRFSVYGHPEQIINVTTHHGSLGQASSSTTRIPPLTVVKVRLNDNIHHVMKIQKKSFINKIGEKIGFKYFETGYVSFDDLYVVKGDDEDFVKSVLNKKSAEAIALGEELSSRYYNITLKNNKIVIKKEDYSEFVFMFQIKKATVLIDRLYELKYL